jgi:hypothetical protein
MTVPNLKEAKIIRIDKANNQILAWFGGEFFRVLQPGTDGWDEIMTISIDDPFHHSYPSFKQVKKRMRELIAAKKGGGEQQAG